MKISKINTFLPTGKIYKTCSPVMTTRLQQDVFEHNSSVSFGQKFNHDYYDIEFQTAISNYIGSFVNIFSNKEKNGNIFKGLGNEKFEFINNFIINDIERKEQNGAFFEEEEEIVLSIIKNRKKINEFFKANNILQTKDIKEYCTFHNQNLNVLSPFNNNHYICMQVYSQLTDKSLLANMPELFALDFYMQAARDKTTDYNASELEEFLKNTKITSYDDLEKKFSCFSEKYNGFESDEDKYFAIKDLMEAYPEKLDFIESYKAKFSLGTRRKDSVSLYAKTPYLIEKYYAEEQTGTLNPLKMENLFKLEKLQPKPKAELYKEFNGLKTEEDKDRCISFLADNNTSIDEVNSMCRDKIILDRDFNLIKNIENKQSIIGIINEETSADLYTHFSDIYNVLYREDNNEPTEHFNSVIKKYNFKNSKDILNLYNGIYNKKLNQNLSKEQCVEFIENLYYCESNDILKDAKQKKIKPEQLLTKGRTEFKKIEPILVQALSDDYATLEYFIGYEPFELYSNFKQDIDRNPANIPSMLRNIRNSNTFNIKQFSCFKDDKIKELSIFFSGKDEKSTLVSFATRNNIKFDGSDSDNEHIDNCLKIFNLVGNEKSKTTLDYFIHSDFISNSKSKLTKDFFEKYSVNELATLLKIIAKMQIPSITAFNKIIDEFSDKNGNYNNVIKHLKNLSDEIKYSDYTKKMKEFKSSLGSLPCAIDNSNILNLTTQHFQARKINTINLLNILYNQDGNFITQLEQSFKPETRRYNRYHIIDEFLKKETKTYSDKYSNIKRLLDLTSEDENVQGNFSEYQKYRQALVNKLPEGFIKLVNSNDWLDYNNDKKHIPNMDLHARLRLIDRYALEGKDDINSLYTKETQDNIKKVLKSIYTLPPTNIQYDDEINRIIMQTEYNGKSIKTVFSRNGNLITIYPPL